MFGLDVHGYTNYDEGAYCDGCDESYPDEQYIEVAVGQFGRRWQCPNGHQQPKIGLSEHFYDFAIYLLAPADDDWVWPTMSTLPLYEQ